MEQIKIARDETKPRYDLIPLEWRNVLARILTEGLRYGENSWKKQPREFFIDCLNHAEEHLGKYQNGDRSEEQLGKVAWNVLAVYWYETTTGDKLK